MRVVILGHSDGNAASWQYVSSYLINGSIAIDAGFLGLHKTPEEQESVRHIFLTHSHADHIASLPFFIENVWTPSPECPTVYGSSATLDVLQRSVFNNEVWPDFVALSERMPPFLRLQALRPEEPIEVEGLVITPVPVDHVVPTFAYIVQDGDTAVVFGADSSPTTRLWEVARGIPGLRGVFLEASFPNRLQAIAEVTMHLTPETFRKETAKFPAGVRTIAVHLKPRFRNEVAGELRALGLPLFEIGECAHEYEF